MKQGSIGEYAIEVSARQGELKKVLMPHFAAAIGSRHVDKTYGSLQPNGNMTKLRKNFQITAGPAAKIQNRAGRITLDVLQKCGDILADVMVFRTRPERIGTFVVPSQS